MMTRLIATSLMVMRLTRTTLVMLVICSVLELLAHIERPKEVREMIYLRWQTVNTKEGRSHCSPHDYYS